MPQYRGRYVPKAGSEGLLAMVFQRRAGVVAGAVCAALLVSGCSSIQQSRGYLVDQVLVASVQPGLDNMQSVRTTLGQPTLKSQFGDERWYYISSVTGQAPFTRPRIDTHSVLTIDFDDRGTVSTAEWSGVERVVRLDPDGDETPTLGRERGLLQDLFGNIGTVGTGMGGPG